jgi:hypothetical protein
VGISLSRFSDEKKPRINTDEHGSEKNCFKKRMSQLALFNHQF